MPVDPSFESSKAAGKIFESRAKSVEFGVQGTRDCIWRCWVETDPVCAQKPKQVDAAVGVLVFPAADLAAADADGVACLSFREVGSLA